MTGKTGRRVALTLMLGLCVGGCGRKGALEPPPDPSAVQKTDADGNVVASPAPKRAKRHVPFVVPQTDFVLDPLL